MSIDTEPGARVVDVAVAYGSNKSTVSRQIAQLEEAGLVRRVDERPGRRGHILELTEKGVQVDGLSHRCAPTSPKTGVVHPPSYARVSPVDQHARPKERHRDRPDVHTDRRPRPNR